MDEDEFENWWCGGKVCSKRVTRYATSLISSRDKGRMMRKEGNIDSIANNIKN